jgi:hypothetical protein
MSDFDDTEIISSYSQQQAIEDGVLVEIFKKSWPKLSGGRPILATGHLYDNVSLAGLMEIWNEFVNWRKEIMPTLPEEEKLFHTQMDGKMVWVIEDASGFTLMFSSDY